MNNNIVAWRTKITIGSDVVSDILSFDKFTDDEVKEIIDSGLGIEIIPLEEVTEITK